MVIEEFLPGREMSVHVLTDGISYRMLPIAQDHKKLLDHDQGPNTGGMGAYAPALFATPELQQRIASEIVEPVLAAFQREAIDFRGILYIGIIWTTAGPRILEFNVRGGDPETQVLLPLLATPLVDILQAVRERRLSGLEIKYHDLYAVTVVMAAAGYPDKPETGISIKGLNDNMKDTFVFHGGTRKEGNNCLTAGGRVLSITAWAADLVLAKDLVYKKKAKIYFAGSQIRCDIAAVLDLQNEN
jgi:phosphoribosylamine--glycine ligase